MGISASSSTSLSASHNKFSSQLFETIVGKNKSSNVVFSPISIQLAMMMATSGSDGETLKELVKGLGYDVPSTIEEWRQLVEPFASCFYSTINKSILNVANNAFVSNTSTLDANYTEHVKKSFNIEVTQCNFSSNVAGEVLKINEWVSKETKGNINNLIEQGVLNHLTRLVLVNAIHFLGQWKNAFSKESTYTDTFYGIEESKVKFMSKSDSKEQYGVEGAYHWVTMPFSDINYKMTIVTVKNRNSQTNINEFVAKKLRIGMEAFPTSEKELSSLKIPKFEINQGIELSDILQNSPFNIRKAFSREAEFTNLISDEVYISNVIHKAVIKVDEAGAEASAATAVELVLTSGNLNAISFKANTPFVFVLSDESTKTVLFVGKVNKL